jgi:N-acetylmuramoyl-L-alanine amidase
MIMKVFSSLRRLVLLLAWCALPVVVSAAELQKVALVADAATARLALDVSKSTTHRLFILKNPHRIVIDLADTRLASGVKPPTAVGLVKQVRFGVQPGGVLRVVLDVNAALPAAAAWLEAGAAATRQLQVEVGQAAATAAVAGAPVVAPAVAPAAVESKTTDEPKSIQPRHAPPAGSRDVVVAIDAGHGGQDPGAIGRGGTREKDVVLAIATKLAERINKESGMQAIMTRKSDQFLTLRERIKRARAAKADIFVSVHADSIRNRAVSGSSVYVLSENGATDEAARWLAERENAADLMGGVSLTDKDNTLASVLLNLSQSANISSSMVAAERVLQALYKVGEVRKPKVQQAGFVVLKSPDIPSMLVETAYISNPAEEGRLKDSSHQRKLADAIFAGIRSYFENNPPPGSRFAALRR